MSNTGQITQLQQELQNELTMANQLLRLISMELQKIKTFTSPGGEFETNIKQNASLLVALAGVQRIDLEKVQPVKRLQNKDFTHNTNQNMSYEQHDSFRNNMDESQ